MARNGNLSVFDFYTVIKRHLYKDRNTRFRLSPHYHQEFRLEPASGSSIVLTKNIMQDAALFFPKKTTGTAMGT